MVRRTRNGAKHCERRTNCPWDTPGTATPKNERPNNPVPKPPSGKGPKRGVCYSLGGGVGRSWSDGLGMVPNLASGGPTARGIPRAQPRPKTSGPTTPSENRPAQKGQNGGCAIALVGGWGEVGPPDSEWGQTLRAASECPRDDPGTAAPKNERPTYPVPKPPRGKWPKRGVCYSLGGRVRRSWSAGLGMGPNIATGLLVPAECLVHSRAQKRASQLPRPKTAQRKRAKKGGML